MEFQTSDDYQVLRFADIGIIKMQKEQNVSLDPCYLVWEVLVN